MIIINYKILEDDSLEIRNNIVEYIAKELNTIPNYLYFPDGLPCNLIDKKNIDIKVIDLLQIIKSNSEKEGTFEQLINSLPSLSDINLNLEELIELFVVYFKINEQIIPMEDDQILIIESKIFSEKYNKLLKKIDVKEYWLNKKNIKKSIRKNIELNNKKIKELLKLNKEMKIKGIKYTNLELKEVKFSLTFNLENFSIMEIFNYLQLNKRIPYASINNTYKIFKNFDINYFSEENIEDWSNTRVENKILLRILHTIETDEINAKDYTLVLIKINEGVLQIQVDNLILNNKNINKDIFIENIFNVLPELNLKTYDYEEDEDEVKTLFYFPDWNNKDKININIYVLSELIMNDPLFSNLYINESIKSTKAKDYIHIYFKNPIIGNLTATITEKISEYGDIDIKNKNIEKEFKYGSYYIRVLTKGKNQNSIQKFQKILSKLLAIYKKKYKNIIDEYKSFDIDISKTSTIEKLKIKFKHNKILGGDKNSQRAERVFFKNWNKKCSIGPDIIEDENLYKNPNYLNWKKGDPVEIIINNDISGDQWYPAWIIEKNTNKTFDVEYYKTRNLKELKNDNKNSKKYIKKSVSIKQLRTPPIFFDKKLDKYVMRYPLINNEQKIKTRNYACDHDKNIYPGLYVVKDKKLNQEGYYYLPCCYSKDPMLKNKKTNGIRQYFYKEKKKEKLEQQNIITGNQTLKNNWYGKLPNDINNILEICTKNQYKILRKGINNNYNPNSFLECILLNSDYDITDDIKNREIYIKNFRKKLANKKYAASCKQELYDYNIKEIIKKINDVDSYFDSDFFTHLLEVKFNCNIFIFRRNRENNIQLVIPRHIKGFYKNLYTKKCIFIYQHLGNKNENLEYFHCERIIFWKQDSDEYLTNVNYNSVICKCVNNIYKKVNTTFILNKLLKPNIFIELNRYKNLIFLNQYIDSCGKCRLLTFNYDGYYGTFITDPLQPFALKEMKKYQINKLDYKIAKKLCKFLNIINIKYNIKNQKIDSIIGNISDSNVKIIIPINYKNSERIIINQDKIIKYDQINYLTNINSELVEFNKYKKLSRYIQEYIFWLYSKYLIEEKIDIDSKDYVNFIQKYIKIIHDFKYKKVKKLFSINSGVMKDKKLIIKSQETLNRLIYGLKLYKIRNTKKLLEYYNNKFIENYYINISDFEPFHFQVILQGENILNKWKQQQNEFNYYIYEYIKLIKINEENYIPDNNPYFFKNNLIDNNVYLTQISYKLETALKISKIWKEEGYNIGYNIVLNDDDILYKNSISYLLYAYESPKNIKSYIIKGKDNHTDRISNFKILIFKNYDDQIIYVSLLSV